MTRFKWRIEDKDIHSFYTELLGLSYKEINLNPEGRDTGDCAIQALSHALKKDYKVVHHDLNVIAEEISNIFNSKQVIIKYLNDNGWDVIESPISTKNVSVGEVLYYNKDKELLVVTKDHMVYVNKGCFYDRKKNLIQPDIFLMNRAFMIGCKESLNLDEISRRYTLREIVSKKDDIMYPYEKESTH